MITVTHLIEQLSKFPQGARVELMGHHILVHPPAKNSPKGSINCPPIGRPRVTNLGGWKKWMDAHFKSAGERIQRRLLEDPVAARSIAFAAVSGLYLDEDDDTALQADQAYPRGAGSDYVDHVGDAIERNHLMPLIDTLQEEAEEVEA